MESMDKTDCVSVNGNCQDRVAYVKGIKIELGSHEELPYARPMYELLNQL